MESVQVGPSDPAAIWVLLDSEFDPPVLDRLAARAGVREQAAHPTWVAGEMASAQIP